MKRLRIALLFTLAMLFVSQSHAQFGYKHTYDTIDGVAISYKWSHAKWWNKSSPLQLRFKIKNTNDYPVKISFELVYMLDYVVKFKSGDMERTLKSGRTISGKLNGYYFESENLTNEEIESDIFTWDFLHFDVAKIDESQLE
ncbi:MAG: hypothetical protein U9Q98_12775 [Bacteroidota bacterium]|nr:hypothetical protein [Bacteroidota bacterium]